MLVTTPTVPVDEMFAAYNQPGFPSRAVKELQRCKDAGAQGIGEIHDKGQGLRSGKSSAPKIHPDDPRVDAVWEKAAELRMPSPVQAPLA